MWRSTVILKSSQRCFMRPMPVLITLKPRRFVTQQQGKQPLELSSNDLMLEHSSKNGMRVTYIGLVSNIGLTVSKGLAGWFMNSAALLADAAHSLSDLLSDFVTLYTFKMSRKLPDDKYPYGYGKFEAVGSLSVSAILLAGSLGIGYHSFELLLSTMNTTPAIDTFTLNQDKNELDPNAAWFALGSILVKEWLYRITLKVGQDERSDVLIANAWHHRSDAYTSIVALGAIGGSYAGISMFDPLGGMLVSGMILKNAIDIVKDSSKDLLDKSISDNEIDRVRSIISKVKAKEIDLIDFYSIRGRKIGPFHHLDLVLHLNPDLSITKAHELEQKVRLAIKQQCKHVREVIIHIDFERQPRHF